MSMLLRSLAIAALCCAVSVPALAASNDGSSSGLDATSDDFLQAKVLQIESETKQDDGTTVEHVQLQAVGGPHVGEEFSLDNTIIPGEGGTVMNPGETVVVERLQKSDGSIEYQFKEKYRLPQIGWLVFFFLLLAFIIGGKRGFTSILGLAVSILILLWFVIPRIIAGGDPFFVSLFGAILIACTSLYLAHGFNKRTSIAFLSTIATLVLATLIDLLFVFGAKLFGMGSEESLYLQSGSLQNIDLRGLLLGGIIIGCLGVLDDITTAQTATIAEISKANPMLTAKELRVAGRAVGREHIASLINTLALAYIGASMPLFLLLETTTDFPLWVTLNGEIIAEEVIRTLVGSATLLVAVPVSTWLAAYFFQNGRERRQNAGDTVAATHTHGYHHH
ncbi:MAG TPA: YibE/F family protein [Candidatus Peribacteraceae bacterium]|nr:YibE/F family protein [Candidatus Peribacteraceae bacterium]